LNSGEATGEVVGYGYQTTPGLPITAGEVPEPTTVLMTLVGAASLLIGFMFRRDRR
jgi:hypothetical protein